MDAPSSLIAERVCTAVSVAGLGLLLLLVITTGAPRTYDEPLHMGTLTLLDDKGFNAEFLRDLPEAPGPLYTVIQWAAGPFTHRTVPGIRLVNVAGFLLVVVLTSVLAVQAGTSRQSWMLGMSLIALPVVWKSAGLALTEMPAMVFLTGFALCMMLFVGAENAPAKFGSGALGGVCLGIAVLGRQPSLAAMGAMPILCRNWRRDLPALALAGSITLLMVLPVFWVWGGLVPPAVAYVDKGIVPGYAVLAFAYAGLLTGVLAPRWFVFRRSLLIAAVVLALLIQQLVWTPTLIPLYSAARRVFPESWLPILGRASITAMIVFGLIFVFSLFVHLYRNWHDRKMSFMLGATFLLLLTPMKVSMGFSSRYIAMVGPFLVFITARHAPNTLNKASRMVGGVLIGALSLWSFYRNALR